MKRYLPYIVGGIALFALGALLVFSVKPQRNLNERITLKQKDKIPYGFYTARNLLPSLFTKAQLFSDKRSPGYWDSLSLSGSNQAVFLVGDLNADDNELEDMMEFARRGNHIFIICKSLSYDATRFFGFNADIYSDESYYSQSADSLRLQLSLPRFKDTATYIYPGRRYSYSLVSNSFQKAIVLGTNEKGHANFFQFKAAEGSIYLHTAPLAFSNYFILHKNNIAYYQQAISVIPADVTKVLWNEYYLFKKNEPQEKEPNWLGVLFQYDAFRWAFLTALFTLLLYVFLEMRRKQRMIPLLQKPKNETLHFVQTIGRLYYDQKNHKDLAQKMSLYFLDHVRTKYKISTDVLDENFIKLLHAKSGFSEKEVTKLVDFIEVAYGDPDVTEQDLAQFHKSLEQFYKNA